MADPNKRLEAAENLISEMYQLYVAMSVSFCGMVGMQGEKDHIEVLKRYFPACMKRCDKAWHEWKAQGGNE